MTPTLFADHAHVAHHSGMDLCLHVEANSRPCHLPAALHPDPEETP